MAEADPDSEPEYMEEFADDPNPPNGFDANHDSDWGKYIYVFGGDVPLQEQGTLKKYTIEEDIWEPVPGLMPHSGRGSGAVLHGKYVWVVGGHSRNGDGHQLSPNVYTYDYQDNIWTTREPLQHGRGYMGVAAIGSRIFAFGGRDGNTGITEMYNVLAEWQGEVGLWMMCSQMVKSRYNFGFYILYNHIYAACGIGPQGVQLDSIERFSPITLQWTLFVGSTGQIRRSFGMGVADDGFVYAIGGDGHDTVSYFAPDQPNHWESLGAMRLPRKHMAIVLASGVFYAIGGAINNVICDAVDCYNPETGIWTELTKVPSARCCPAVLVFNTAIWGQQ